jgi:uncharacterized protein YllA (UPF0747 family)
MEYAAYITAKESSMSESKEESKEVKKGRPSKKDLESTTLMTKREQAAAIKEYRQRLLLHPGSPKLIDKLFSTAFDDESRNQAVAMKILADRVLPAAGFTFDGKTNNQVSINITGLNDPSSGVTISGSSGEVEDEDVHDM